jgi:hypothetical protein
MAPPPGEKHFRARLTAEKVLKIRHAYRMRGVTYLDLANWYDVGLATISNVLAHRSWKHLDCDCCLNRCTYWERKV